MTPSRLGPWAIASFICVIVPTTADAQTPARGEQGTPSLGERLEIELANGSEAEARTAAAIRRLVDEHDVGRWIFTESIVIDENSIPHSHPVLTVHTRSLGNDNALLATFLHEQFHWLEDMVSADFRGAMAAFESIWEDPPVGSPEGARDRESGYRHLVVCDLEFQALTALIGEADARSLLAGTTHYTWIYDKVLNDSRVREVNERFRMTVERDFRATR